MFDLTQVVIYSQVNWTLLLLFRKWYNCFSFVFVEFLKVSNWVILISTEVKLRLALENMTS